MDPSFVQKWAEIYSLKTDRSELNNYQDDFDAIDKHIKTEIGRIKHTSLWQRPSLTN